MNWYDIWLFFEKNLKYILITTLFIMIVVLRQYDLFMFRKYKRLISQYYSEDELVQFLWRDKVIFPIIRQKDKIPVKSLHIYKKDYLYVSSLSMPVFGTWLQEEYIIDKTVC